MRKSQSGILRLIALFKLLKALLLIVTGIGLLKLVHNDISSTLEHWIVLLGIDPGNRFIDHALRKAANISPHRLKDVGLGSFLYAALFLTEGTGLWLLKRWAEWFTVVITGSLIPVEVYEIHRHPSAIKVLILIINVAVVVYLVMHIRRENSESRTKA
jgi:uncharacterized membrane protein (DUF2068 family)